MCGEVEQEFLIYKFITHGNIEACGLNWRLTSSELLAWFSLSIAEFLHLSQLLNQSWNDEKKLLMLEKVHLTFWLYTFFFLSLSLSLSLSLPNCHTLSQYVFNLLVAFQFDGISFSPTKTTRKKQRIKFSVDSRLLWRKLNLNLLFKSDMSIELNDDDAMFYFVIFQRGYRSQTVDVITVKTQIEIG